MYDFGNSVFCTCAKAENCVENYSYLCPIRSSCGFCGCGCISLLKILVAYFKLFILPFIITYFIFYLFEKMKIKKKK